MFRGCFFEYAGQNSNIYNLQLYYYNRYADTLSSGGEYEPKTDVLPDVPEQFLYGLDYSNHPLEFDIEIINPDRAIPIEQISEIKNWLFGQDGWKVFKTFDEMQDYHLRCLLIPEEDIIDGMGYRGFKCKLKNISAFWYGEEQVVEFNKDYLQKHTITASYGDKSDRVVYWTPFKINTPKDVVGLNIFPKIEFQVSDTLDSNDDSDFSIGLTRFSTIEELINYYTSADIYPEENDDFTKSNIVLSLLSVPHNTVGVINTKFIYLLLNDKLTLDRRLRFDADVFQLEKGSNIGYILYPENLNYLKITYTPRYRKGAF